MLNLPVLETPRLFLRPFEPDDLTSQGVMRRLGMQILHNSHPEPAWLQVLGVLRNPACRAG